MNVNDIKQQFNYDEDSNRKQRRKCHGNRRDQRFRKKCRAQGMQIATIKKLLEERDRVRTTNNHTKTSTYNTGSTHMDVESKQIRTNSSKRKRDVLSQEESKKMKNKPNIMTISSVVRNNNKIGNTNYRQSMYLKQSSAILFQVLSKILKYPLKKKDEQRFIYVRLISFDQQYCTEIELQLWHSYVDIALQHHIWPDQIYALTKTNNFEACQQFVVHYIHTLQQRLNQCQLELSKHSHLCPITILSLNQIDHSLKEMVDYERKYLSTRNNRRLFQFKDKIHENDLSGLISTYRLTIYQNESINQLMKIRREQIETWKEFLMFETRILCKCLPQNFDELERFIAPNIYSPAINNSTAIQFKNQRYKIIQEAKRQWLNVFLNVYELKIREYQEQYEYQLTKLQTQLLRSAGSLIYNHIQEYISYQTEKLKKDVYKGMFIFRRKVRQRHLRSYAAKNSIGVSPESYLDLISNPFNPREWNHLSLGPSCIRFNQSAIRPRKQQEIEIRNEHKDISTKVQDYLVEHHHIPRTIPIFKQYGNHLLDYLNRCYFTPLLHRDRVQALEQTDKSNIFYIGSTTEFQKKAKNFFSDTNAFVTLSYNPFNEIFDKAIQLLNKLASKKLILQWPYKKMMPDPTKCELAHLYFNPKTHKDGIPVRPIENTIHASTRNISKFLDRIIRPVFDNVCATTTIIDGASLIKQLNTYVNKCLLKPSTLLCTFDIHNLYTMLPQDEAVDILIEFLQIHGYTKVKSINLETIRALASVVLKENVFVYEKRIYKQVIGGAMGSSFTLTLANIFMWKWQKELVRRQDMSGEFYGRYIDDVFMIWNRSEKELIKLLDEANTWHPNIKLDYKIGQCLPFLDVLLANNNGILSTSVYHKPATEPYVVPYKSDHPRHVFRNVIQTALTRAIRYSSTFEAYQQEKCQIRLMLLYNEYPPSYIEKQFEKFYFQYVSSLALLSPSFNNEKEFFLMHNKLLDQPTARQSQVAQSAARADLHTYQMNDTNIQTKKIFQPTEYQQNNKASRLIIHYVHEKRFHSFKRDMHQVYDSIFQNTPVADTKMIVGNRNRRDAKHELIRKRPKRSLLKNIPKMSNYYTHINHY
ncbi:unnamed protein product [Adineta ricciae]|uniref:Reverse transcriptase domain-containing protein n=1 Tax=Adineta ricciae TaxID=249248 RepID=A0A815AKB5_ADIRI|nr:unnamed protein product [Adineta ricciae]